VAKHAVSDALRDARLEDAGEQRAPAMRREVHQATGVVLVQLNITPTEAFFVLRAYAFANGLAVLGVAQDVLAGRLNFSDLPD
jgi:AmiR/NasT family two-component response regulator